MATFRRGPFRRNIKVPDWDGDRDSAERRYAWRLYVEMTNRRAVCGDPKAADEPSFLGEVFMHSLDSMKEFEMALRNQITGAAQNVPEVPLDRLPTATAEILELVISPFLEKWRNPFREWWLRQDNSNANLLIRQDSFPAKLIEPLEDEWRELRTFSRNFCRELSESYELVSIFSLVPDKLREEWQEEAAKVWKYVGEDSEDEQSKVSNGGA